MPFSPSQIGFLLLYSTMMSVGQILFKYIARDLGQPASFTATVFQIALNPLFWTVGFLYLAATMLWVWLLTSIPLNIAYPFQSLALIIVPCLTWFLFSEPLTWQYWIGLSFIILGIALVVR